MIVKSAVFGVAACCGLNRVWRALNRRRLTILCYHGVVTGDHPGAFDYRNTVSAREFKRQMEFLSRHYNPVSAADLRAWSEGLQGFPERAALVTFDDGYRNNVLAASIMARCGVPGVIHVTTGYIGTARLLWPDELRLRVAKWPKPFVPAPAGGPDIPVDSSRRGELSNSIRRQCKRMPAEAVAAYLDRLRETPIPGWSENEELFAFLSWDEVRGLRSRGFEIGSHTVEHLILSQASAGCLRRELEDSKAAVERETGRECYAIAYPNGAPTDFNEAALAAARAAGYKLGFTMTGRLGGPSEDPLALPRLCAPGHVSQPQFEARVSWMHRPATQ